MKTSLANGYNLQGGSLSLRDEVDCAHDVLLKVRGSALRHLDTCDAQGPHIRILVVSFALQDLRRHI